MKKTQFKVNLTDSERKQLKGMKKRGTHGAQKLRRAEILLLRDEDKHGVRETARLVDANPKTVSGVCKRYCEGGLELALERKKQSGRRRSLEEKGVAVLCEMAQSKPPEGRKRWTLKLLAERMVELQLVEDISTNTVGRELKKRRLSLT